MRGAILKYIFRKFDGSVFENLSVYARGVEL